MINAINKTANSTSFTFTDIEIGSDIQEYQLLAVDGNGNSTTIANETVFIQAANPELNCVKLNHLYRMACHNCYDSIISFTA